MGQAVCELFTYTRCMGTCVAAGLTSTQILAPRFGRLLAWSLAAAAANDFLGSTGRASGRNTQTSRNERP